MPYIVKKLFLNYTGVTVQGISATAQDDFSSSGANMVSFSAGENEQIIEFDIFPDSVCEDIETFTISLTNPSYACSAIGRPNPATVYIVDETGKIRHDHDVA